MSQLETVEIRGMTPRTRSMPRAQWYESSRWSPNRSWIWFPVQDAKHDLDRFTRYELNKRAEALWKNSPFMRGLTKRLVTLIIGRGAVYTPKTSSEEFNLELKAFLKTKFRRPAVDNKKDFCNYQRVKMTGLMKHGESFTVHVSDELTGEDKIQGFEWHRCAGSNSQAGSKQQLVFGSSDSFFARASDKKSGGDGIEFYDNGHPKAYRFLGMDQPVPEELVVHHSLIERDEQVRGETIFASAINTAHDVKDILDFEKAAVKDASSKQDIIQTMSGELDPEAMLKLPFGAGQNNFPTPMSLPSDDTAKISYYNTKFQGAPVILKTGDKYTPYVPNRPGNAWQGFMAFLANMTVLSTGFPPSVVLPIDIGGTDIRRDIQIAQDVAEIHQDDFEGDLQAIVEWFILGGIEDRIFKSKIPADWNAGEWHFPGSLTVDRNRDADRRAAVESGLMSWDEFFGETGRDGMEQWKKISREVRQRRFDIVGTPIDSPFASAQEFKEFLALTMKTTETVKQQEDVSATGAAETAPGKKNKPQTQNT